MRNALSLYALVALMDRWMMPSADDLSLRNVCIAFEQEIGVANMDQEEAREIMLEIDAKSSALLAVLAIILATSAFVFSLDQTWLTLVLMFAQVVTISVSILFLLRCLIYEPAPRLHEVFALRSVVQEHHLQIEAIKQVRYFNRVIVMTGVTALLFFVMAVIVGIDAMMAPEM